MNQSYSMIDRMLETGDGCISRKAAIANGVAPASFARYVRSHGLIKIRRGVYTNEIGAVDDLFQLQRRYPKIVYSGKEKMVVEMIRKRNDYDSELFLKAVKSFLKGKDKDLDFLFQYARMRKIEEKVYQVLELMDYEN